MYNQTVYGSIGFAAGSAVGAFVAGKELGLYKRNILVTGEGSLQLTVQAFADLIRHELNPIVFLLNNDGYTIERLIHGSDAPYNTVPIWDYGALFQAFAPRHKTKHILVQTPEELDALLNDTEFAAATTPTVSNDCLRMGFVTGWQQDLHVLSSSRLFWTSLVLRNP